MDRHGRGHGGAGQGDGFLGGGGSILDLEGLTRIVTEPYTTVQSKKLACPPEKCYASDSINFFLSRSAIVKTEGRLFSLTILGTLCKSYIPPL